MERVMTSVLFRPKERFVWDASAWMGVWKEECFPRSPAFLSRLEAAVQKGVIVSPPEVVGEVRNRERKQDDLGKWVEMRRKLLVEPLQEDDSRADEFARTADISSSVLERNQDAVEQVVAGLRNDYTAVKTNSGADYYVVAWGIVFSGVSVVSSEKQPPHATKPRSIPGMCQAEGIRHYSLREFVAHMKWKIPK